RLCTPLAGGERRISLARRARTGTHEKCDPQIGDAQEALRRGEIHSHLLPDRVAPRSAGCLGPRGERRDKARLQIIPATPRQVNAGQISGGRNSWFYASARGRISRIGTAQVFIGASHREREFVRRIHARRNPEASPSMSIWP